MSVKKDITGQKFGRLFAIKDTGKRNVRKVVWRCLCECGSFTEVTGRDLRSGHTRSCGCLRSEVVLQPIKHGHCSRNGYTKIYRVWQNMLQRCNDSCHPGYLNYGGRGIKVCDQWKDFRVFLEDMGKRPEGLTIDRIDNDGNYEPGNCRWVTSQENCRNTRRSKLNINRVRRIKQLLRDTKRLYKEIAKLYNVEVSTIGSIKTGRTWSDIKI